MFKGEYNILMKNLFLQKKPILQNDLFSLFLLFLIWFISIIIVNPVGDFPLNDDWAYARSVQSIVVNRQLELDTWPAMTLIAQIGIGTAYCEIFGFSFEVLRWSTLINSLFCLLLYFLLLRKFTNVFIARFASLLLFFNPLFFSLSFTFMTEVHFQIAILASLFFFSIYIESTNNSFLVLGGLFSVIATLIRQPGFLVPLSFAIVLFFREKFILRKILVLLPAIISFIALQGYNYWLGIAYPEVEKMGGFQELLQSVYSKRPEDYIRQVVNILLYTGLFLLPLVFLFIPQVRWKNYHKQILKLLTLGLTIAFLCIYLHYFFVGNVFYNFGLGPKLLKGVDFSHSNVTPSLSKDLWRVLNYLALFGTIGGLLILLQKPLSIKPWFSWNNKFLATSKIKMVIVLYSVLYFILLNLMPSLFDRYLIHLFPFIVILMLPNSIKGNKYLVITGGICLTLYAVFSIGATHDYLSWNRARKAAYDFLKIEQNIPPTFIDGGFEINGWHQAGPDRFNSQTDKSWWFVSEDDYVIAFKELPRFRRWKSYPFNTFFPLSTDSIFILKKAHVLNLEYDDFPIHSNLEKIDSTQTKFLSNHPSVTFSGGNLHSKQNVRSGQKAIQLNHKAKYGLTTQFWNLNPGDTILVSVWRYPSHANTGIVIDSDYQNILYDYNDKRVVGKSDDGWEQLQSEIIIPDYHGQERFSIYIWNPGGKNVWWDDLVINRK